VRQSVIIAGDTLYDKIAGGEFPASEGWTLRYFLTPVDANLANITFDATTDPDNLDDYLLAIGPAITAGWTAGEYAWSGVVIQPGSRTQVDKGFLTIVPDPATRPAGTDLRSPARRALADLQALASGGYQSHIKEYEIAGRRMVFASPDEVTSAISLAKFAVWNEDAAAAMAEGLPNPRNVTISFGRR
jgi:hypothetical protein